MAAAAEVALSEELQATSKVVQVNVDDVKVDSSYQRQVSTRMVDSIVENWDDVASELLLVSDRGETGLWLVNGQHRTAAAKKKGIKKLYARVLDLRDHPDPAKVEANLRLMTNVRLGDKATERFKAQLRSGNEESIAIVKIMDKFDTEINEVPMMETGINSVAGIEAIYRVDSGGLLTEVFEVVKQTWGEVGGKTATVNILKGISWFILKHAQEVDRNRLVQQLQIAGPSQLDRRARANQSVMGGSLWLNYYRTIVELYNDKLADKNRLEYKTRGSAGFKAGQSWGNG